MTESNTSASHLDLLLSIGTESQFHTSIYYERDDFNLHITNFPFMSSIIPFCPEFLLHVLPFARSCSSYGYF